MMMLRTKNDHTSSAPVWLITCVGVGHDLALLPHWLRHYLALGVEPDRFVVILNTEDPRDPGLLQARHVLVSEGVTRPPEVWIAPYTSGSMWQKRRQVQARLCGQMDWVLNADVDEFHRWPESLAACLSRASRLGANCVQGVMIDRLAVGGRLAPVEPTPHVFAQFPVRAEVAMSIGGSSQVHGRGGTVKLMAVRGSIMPSRGGHNPAAGSRVRYLYRWPLGDFREIDDPVFRFSVPTQVDHVHWTNTLPDRLRKRLATPGVSPAGQAYGQRQLDHFACNQGGINLGAIALEDEIRPRMGSWPCRLAELRRRGRIKPVTSPVHRILDRLSSRPLRWARATGSNLLRFNATWR